MFDTGDSNEDTVVNCGKDNRWTWNYGSIVHTNASVFKIKDEEGKEGYFFVKAMCRVLGAEKGISGWRVWVMGVFGYWFVSL